MPYKLPHNKPELKQRRKELRNNSTSAEAVLWTCLKKSQLGYKFRRQHSVGNYILDFYCPTKRLAIELDGAGHYTEDGIKLDAKRDKVLEGQGINVLRIENRWVFENLSGVLDAVIEKLNDVNNSTTP